MKKIILKRENLGSKGYKINYALDLNKPQYDAVMHDLGPALVIAGAGTGKTRTLVYRVARLIEDGVPPEAILLLTFTRKAAAEMLRRASSLLDGRCEKVSGGTFHSFAANMLRRYAKSAGIGENFNIIDQSDSEDVINLVRSKLGFGDSKRRFPKKSTISKIYSLAVNTQSTINEVIEQNYPFYSELAEEITFLIDEYKNYKKSSNLMDYDDLLVYFLSMLKNNKAIRDEINGKYKYLMVDEYQDTNRIQHEISLLLAGKNANIVAVGDDAQSIYSFRGSNYQNIMFFPGSFSDCKIFRIEENYRSVNNILNFTNEMINAAYFKYEKNLFSKRASDEKPKIISTRDEREQSLFVVQQILEFRESGIPLSEIAVLFRSGFHTFDLEIELEHSNIPFVKFGGMKFVEAAHVKDLLSFFRILYNPLDAVSWQRILLMIEGVGPASALKIIDAVNSGELNFKNYTDFKFPKNRDEIIRTFEIISRMYGSDLPLGDKSVILAEHLRPYLQSKYDDWEKRWKDLESFMNIAERYKSLASFLNDMAIDPPAETLSDMVPESKEEEYLTLSTIHSAKGLEWSAVFIIWALEGRFPSSKSVDTVDSLEEERRLFYVASTRAKNFLYITYPTNIFDRESGFVLSRPSRFVENISDELTERYIIDSED